MQQIPSTEDLARLGASIHDHGFRPNEQQLTDIAILARQVRPDWVVLDVATDRAYPDVVRARALSRLSADWQSIRLELETFRARFEADLDALLARWNAHQDLRLAGAHIPELVDSRSRLDTLRLGMGRYRQLVSR
ncbi:MAG: hypothetical protein OEZ14_08790 [Acidimicrobiia bacterium]|nr:hypothetical protein [Acidimicrobiia bacterium]MDH5520616.1 hypothetical protein [Acidimicrobiia bacterium]